MKMIIAVLAGGMAGFLLYKFVGCTSGTCPLIGNPFISIICGGFFGFLMGIVFKKKDENEIE